MRRNPAAGDSGNRRGTTTHRQAAFTLIELLIVIAIIGTLATLLLPAVQAAREAARRTQCTSRMRQIAIAMHGYEAMHGHFPPGYVSNTERRSERDPQTWDAPPGWGWSAAILPFMEEGQLSEAIDWSQPIWAEKHRRVVATQIETYLCPSSSGPDTSFLVRNEDDRPLEIDGSTIRLGRSNYVASHGQESCWGECGAQQTTTVFTNIYTSETKEVRHRGDASFISDGPFYRNSRTSTKQIVDGLSKTIFIGEHSSALSDKSWAGVVPGAHVHPRFSTPENGSDAAATLVLVHGGPSGGELDITGFPIIHPVNFPTLHVGQMYSEHAGGGNVALGDTSVRFVSEDVNLLLWAAYSSMNEGEILREEL